MLQLFTARPESRPERYERLFLERFDRIAACDVPDYGRVLLWSGKERSK
jgi:hypothetical protein